MSIHKRPDSTGKPWQVRWREGGRQRSASFTTRREAVQYEAEVARAIRHHAAPAVASAITLGEWLETWVRVHGPTWAPSTLAGRGVYGDKWIDPYLGHLLLGQIGRGEVNRWRTAMLRDGATNSTANHALRALSAALGRAVEEGIIQGNPCAGVRALRHRVERPRALRALEVWLLIGACQNPRDRRLIGLMAFAGLRPGEALGLRWDDVGPRLLHVSRSVRIDGSVSTPKSGRARTVPLDPRLAGLLAAGGQGLVAGRLDDGTALAWRAWYRHQWLGIRKRAGVTCAPYDLRHTYASAAIAAGRTVVEVAAAMGHADPSLTLRRYAHLFADHAASPSS